MGPNGIARSEGGSSSSCQGKLRLFVDSANVNTWRQWLPSGTFYGLFFKLICVANLFLKFESSMPPTDLRHLETFFGCGDRVLLCCVYRFVYEVQ